MDLKNYRTQETEWMIVCDPFGTPTDIRIELAGRDSEPFKKATRRIAEARRKKQKGLKPVEEERMWIESFAKCTVNWENLEDNGEKLECTFDNAVRIYSAYDFVLEQVIAFIQERENFLEN